MSTQAGAYFLEKPFGGRGLLLGGVPGVAPGRVVIIGGGIVGYNAAIMALGLGAEVTILERSIDRMRHLEEILSGRVTLLMSLAARDRLVGRGRRPRDRGGADPGALAPKLVTREMIREMNDGAVVVDVAIDQGGCFETSRPTTHTDPVFVVDGVIHYCVANMPGGVPVTSTKALTNATLPYVEAIAGHGLRAAVEARPRARQGRQRARREGDLRGRRRGTRPRVHAARDARSARSRPSASALAASFLRRRAQLDDGPGHGGRQRDHADDEDDEADQPEDVLHHAVG